MSLYSKREDTFFSQSNCDRCGGDLVVRIMSWFTTETICMKCSEKENNIKKALKDAGKDPATYEGCGYIPKVEEVV